jgi:HEAT repeat protein
MSSLLLAALLAAPISYKAPQPPISQDTQVQPNDDLSDVDVRQHVDGFLGSIDTPIRPNQWKALGPRAVPILEAIVKNPEELPTRRAKAIDGLTALGDKSSPALFARIANTESEKINVRFAAVRGLAQVTPRPQAAQALRPLLEKSKDPRVRAVAAEQLAIRSQGKSCDLVRAQLQRERSETRSQYGRAMKQCGVAQ